MRPPATRPQKAEPTPAQVMPEAVTTKVTTAPSLPSARVKADDRAAPSAAKSASPATASTSTGGDRSTRAAAALEQRPSPIMETPAVTEAIQRREGSGSASGEA